MSDGNSINVTLAQLPVSHNENVKLSNFARLQNNLKPYTTKANKLPDLDSKKPFINTTTKTVKLSSTLSSLISNSAILARVEANPSLRAAILSNPSLVDIITNNPALLTALIKSPGLLTSLTSNPDLLSSIKDNPTLSIESILERLAKKPETNSSPNTKNNLPQTPHPLDKSTIAAERARPAIKAVLSRVKAVGAESLEVQKQQASQIIKAKILEARVLIKTPMIQTLKPAAYFDTRLFAINPSLLALLGAAAFVSNRIKVIPVSGNLKDAGVEVETQSESQPDAIQESDQVDGIGEVGEIHSVSEATM